MIRVEIRLYASLRKYTPQLKLGEAMEIPLREGITMQQLISTLRIPMSEVKRIIINGIAEEQDYILSNGDRIAIFPPVAGG